MNSGSISRAFASDTGFTFFGVARLGELPVGTHVFDVTITDTSGLVAHATVEVVVSPLQFTVAIVSPVESPASPYYAYAGLPVSATEAQLDDYLACRGGWANPPKVYM